MVQNDTANLATIQQLDPIYADFTQSVSELYGLRRAFDLPGVPIRIKLRRGDNPFAPRRR